jgi:integrase
MAKQKINLSSVKALKPGEQIWDTELIGFGCRYRKDGRYFMLKYSIFGRQRFYTIGRWDGSLTPEQARHEAEKLRGQIRSGIDPLAEKDREKAISLVQDAFTSYLDEIKSKRSIRTHDEYKRLFEKLAKKKIGKYQLNAIARADIARLHNALKNTPYQANRILAVLSSFFSWCIKHGHRTDENNPCKNIEKYKEKSRERFLSEEELYRLGEAIEKYEDDHKFLKSFSPNNKQTDQINHATSYITAALRLLILTGARCSEILTLKWEDIDFQRKLIRLQESKTGQKTIYLSAPALQTLSELPRIEGNPYVICGKNEGSHLVNIKDPWKVIRKNAELEDVRIHDLRHNYASTAVTAGHHLKVIGSLLGHKDTQTTERYTHLANDPLQTANEAISQRILDAMKTKPDQTNIEEVNFRK